MKYKVIAITNERIYPEIPLKKFEFARKIKNDYGLYMYNLREILETWEQYTKEYNSIDRISKSIEMVDGLLLPFKEGIELAFGVKLRLEENTNGNDLA